MCGINGIFGLETLTDVPQIIGRMNEAMAHRGPDADGLYTDDRVALGHRRLSIIDLSDAGNQPFHSADGDVVLVVNGEIYNYIELKEQLSDYPFKTESDTEVLIAAYLKWGISMLQKLNGMFALAVWDRRSNEMFLARDRMGIKPLYISRQKQQILFSSEIRSLLESGLVPRKLDENGLVDYLRYGTVHAPLTLVADVEMILPGHYVHIGDNHIDVKSYWSIATHLDGSAQYADRATAKAKIQELLKDSISLRMRADVPFGAFLSGGIDSSAIVGLMSQVSPRPVKTFSVTFDEEEFNEGPWAQMIADKFKTEHTDIRLKIEDFLEQVPAALESMDHPSADGPNTYVVSKVTKAAGVTMALSGLGGDELFAGYDIFKRMHSLQGKKWLTSFPKGLRLLVGKLIKILRPGVASEKLVAILGLDYLDFEYVYPLSRQILLDKQVSKLVERKKLPQNSVQKLLSESIAHGNLGFGLPLLSKVSQAEISTYMQNVLLRDSDQMSMAHALEVRVPFLDHKLVEYATGINDKVKYPHSPKQLLVEALGDLLPDEVVNRPKMGFTFPWEHWMKNELKDLCETQISQLALRPQFNESGINDLWSQFLSSKVSWSRVWHLVVLNHWMERNGIK
ncbi:MAG: asparagine synthase (glutamine-hydrolyzing) [Flavobacteriales bacterium]|jgi:asparagine synthase (glutamine-hydrolysing)